MANNAGYTWTVYSRAAQDWAEDAGDRMDLADQAIAAGRPALALKRIDSAFRYVVRAESQPNGYTPGWPPLGAVISRGASALHRLGRLEEARLACLYGIKHVTITHSLVPGNGEILERLFRLYELLGSILADTSPDPRTALPVQDHAVDTARELLRRGSKPGARTASLVRTLWLRAATLRAAGLPGYALQDYAESVALARSLVRGSAERYAAVLVKSLLHSATALHSDPQHARTARDLAEEAVAFAARLPDADRARLLPPALDTLADVLTAAGATDDADRVRRARSASAGGGS